ncbi:putative protein phosphatase 2C-like protein 44 isoform X2 [Chenopodium quinoa]|uniref:putative protein phosphatase 2C-like protein 44 isoform X2 n=1 Tax=Chenopodium quinoa TaxID=63459 RepID=UPI000B78FAC0|nr:putative protein phosphatase 2C-like protein 44 isoform X2 [Chenopodium quinoa]
MKLKNIYSKLQVFRWKSLLKGSDDVDGGANVKGSKNVKKPSWMTPISHGYHILEARSWGGEEDEVEKLDNVVVQREEKEGLELWFYGVSDASIGDGISRYLQSNFFDRKFKESLVVKASKDTMRKAYLDARAKLESDKPEKMVKSASAMIINGEKIVMAQMGGYRAIVCRDGMAHQLRVTHQYTGKRHWPHRLISGAMRIPRVRIQACHTGSESSRKQTDSLELIAASERIDSETEFIILASNGIFEVMRNQEAVDLIRHIDDPQEAAECLAREASMRMSRSNISCVVIRFD